MKIEALHLFHNEEYSREWSGRFNPTAGRLDLFETISQEIKLSGESETQVLELGIGPGFLAYFILQNGRNIRYEGLDFSKPMLKIAAERNLPFKDRLIFTEADLTNKDWIQKVRVTPQFIISTWALHDLLGKNAIAQIYENAYKLLPFGGVFMNGDFVRPEGTKIKYEAGRISVTEHLELLSNAGFEPATCIAEFEKDVDNPTTANNYVCLKAIKMAH